MKKNAGQKLTILFFPLVLFSCTSLIACSRHFTSSVGQRVRDEKKAAKNPAQAFPKELNSDTLFTPARIGNILLFYIKVIYCRKIFYEQFKEYVYFYKKNLYICRKKFST